MIEVVQAFDRAPIIVDVGIGDIVVGRKTVGIFAAKF
jgi:hypothetical protein